jgi:hypothetical protein
MEIVFLLILFTVTQSAEVLDQNTIRANNKYFGSLDPKPTKLHYCNPKVNSQRLYRLPKSIQCEYLKLEKPNTVIPVTFWHDTPGIQSIEAFTCKFTSTFAYKDSFFLGGYAEHAETTDKYISPAACREMLISKISPDGDKLVHIGSNTWSTKNEITIDFKWPSYYEETVNNYFISTITIAKSNLDSTIITSIPLLADCPFDQGSCQTLDKSVLIWDQHLPTSCRLTKGPSTLCLYSIGDDRLTCPQLTISVTNTSHIDICNQQIFTSFQGLLFTTDRSGDIDNITATTSMMEHEIELVTENRKKREIPIFEGDEDLIPSVHAVETTNHITTTTAKPVTQPPPIFYGDEDHIEHSVHHDEDYNHFEEVQKQKPIDISTAKNETLPVHKEPNPIFHGSEDVSIEESTYQEPSFRPIKTPPNDFPGLTHLPLQQADQSSMSSPIRFIGTEEDVIRRFKPEILRRESRVFTDSEVNARLQFLYTVIQQNLTSALQEVHHSCCINQKMILDLLISMAEQRQAGFITRVLLPNERYMVQNSGDAIELRKCIDIDSYYFLPRNEVNCSRNIPIKYVYDHMQFHGYMNEMSHQIVDEPEYISCSEQRPFYFDTVDDGMILLSNISTTFNIPYLPTSAQFERKLNTLEDQVFKTPAVFTTNEISSQDTLLSMIQQYKQPATLDNVIRATVRGDPLSEAQQQVADSLRSFALTPIQNLLYQIGLLLLFLFLFTIFLRVLWAFRKLISSTFCGFCSICRKTATSASSRLSRRKSYSDIPTSDKPPSYQATKKQKKPKTKSTAETVLAFELEELQPVYRDLSTPSAPHDNSDNNYCSSCGTPQDQIALPFNQAILRDDVPMLQD